MKTNFSLTKMAEKFCECIDKNLNSVPQQTQLKLPKLKKIGDSPKLKLPKLKKVN